MAREPFIEELIGAARGDLADFRALMEICERQLECLASPNLDDLSDIVEEKEALIEKIRENENQNASLWSRIDDWMGEASALDGVDRVVDEVRETVEEVRKAEGRIGEILNNRAADVRKAMSSLSRGGKALSAYKPIHSYAPRFIDKKE